MALALSYRLKKEKDFNLVIKEGRTVKSSFFLFKFIPNQLNKSRFGVAISSKIAPRAVDRNRLKRLITSSLQELWPSVPLGLDVVIIGLKPVTVASGADIRNSIKDAIGNIK